MSFFQDKTAIEGNECSDLKCVCNLCTPVIIFRVYNKWQFTVTNGRNTVDPSTRHLTGSWTTVTKLAIVNQTTISRELDLINWGFVPRNLFHMIKVPINYEKRKSSLHRCLLSKNQCLIQNS